MPNTGKKLTFAIQQGEIIFGDDCIQINDKSTKWTKGMMYLLSVYPVLYGLLLILRYFKTREADHLWIGSGLGLIGIPGLIYQSGRTFIRQINFHSIEKVIIKMNLFNTYVAVFKLTNAKRRTVLLDQDNYVRFQKYSLDDFVKALNEKNITTEII